MNTLPQPADLRARARRFADRVAARVAHGTPLDDDAPAPPGPDGSVVLGSLVEGWTRPLELFARCAESCGPVARMRLGHAFYHLVNEPALVHRVFVENARNYRKSRYYRGVRIVLGDGLFTSEGDFWRRQRRLAQPGFHRERLAGFASVMAEETAAALNRWRWRSGEVVDLDRMLNDLALRIACRTLFREELAADVEDFAEAVRFTNAYCEMPFFLPRWVPTATNRSLARTLDTFDGLIARMIRARRSPSGELIDQGDLLSMLMRARDEETGEGMSDRQLRDEALTLLVGGHETTAATMAWTFYLLSLHPDVARRVRSHVAEVIGDRDPRAEDVPRLTYVWQVVQEAMRLYPPAWVLERETLGHEELAGYRLPPGSTVAACAYTLHRHPGYWPNPEGFDPERFAPERAKDRPRGAYIPFGVGPRVCIGGAFAQMETVIMVAMIVRAMRFDLVPGPPLELEPLITLRPRHGLRMRAFTHSSGD
jgi:cytochrome P450